MISKDILFGDVIRFHPDIWVHDWFHDETVKLNGQPCVVMHIDRQFGPGLFELMLLDGRTLNVSTFYMERAKIVRRPRENW